MKTIQALLKLLYMATVNLKRKCLSSFAGRWFGGFDSLENALMKNELVQKEARTPK